MSDVTNRRDPDAFTDTDLTSVPLLTHEVGSLDKLGWRTKAVAGKKVGEADIQEARVWGGRVDVEGYEELIALLEQSPLQTAEQKEEVKRW